MRNLLVWAALLLACGSIEAAGFGRGTVTYTRQDSLKVVELLAEGLKEQSSGARGTSTNLMLYYGKKLQGVPYVAHTLEVNKKEKLVVNLREMDCTTFVEMVFALALTTKQGSKRWEDYCRWLQTIRYKDGKMAGYVSRNHYFLWWLESNRSLGLIETPIDDDVARCYKEGRKQPSIVQRQIVNIKYMSTHSSAYKMLKGNKTDIEAIAALEKQSRGKTVMYIPAAKTGVGRQQMMYKDALGKPRCYVEDGDILAIATKKQGLDTSHIGIAEWGKDGKLHLLNASQIHKKVVLETMTLQEYMAKHPTHLGIWVLRPTL